MANDHIHKYGRVFLGEKKTPIFRCFHVNCPHYVFAGLIRGRASICWKCGKEMVMTARVVKKKPAKPFCPDCWKPKAEKDVAIEKIMKELEKAG